MLLNIQHLATCSDGLKNGEELGVDCGGPKCNPCHGKCIL